LQNTSSAILALETQCFGEFATILATLSGNAARALSIANRKCQQSLSAIVTSSFDEFALLTGASQNTVQNTAFGRDNATVFPLSCTKDEIIACGNAYINASEIIYAKSVIAG
jgi:hypothetical protein